MDPLLFKTRVELPRRWLGVRAQVPQPRLEVVESTGNTNNGDGKAWVAYSASKCTWGCL